MRISDWSSDVCSSDLTADFAMMLANDELRVLLVTIHMALAKVPQAITPQAEARAIRLADRACRQMGIEKPRIAVAGLNPHAGEDGKFGHEDLDIIAPAVAEARAAGLDVSGTWPGDTILMSARRGACEFGENGRTACGERGGMNG